MSLRFPIGSIALACTLFFIACGGGETPNSNQNSGTTTPNESQNPAATDKDPRPKIYLDGFYATSEAKNFAAARLFDADAKSGWRTQNGAAPDEGLMLYFSDNQQVDIQKVEVATDAASSIGAGATFVIYTNGQMNNSGSPNSTIVLEKVKGDKNFGSMFIRIWDTGTETQSKKTMPQGSVQIKNFPSDKFVGIENLRFFNSAGQEVRLVAPEIIAGKISGSTLEPESAYSPTNLFDSRRDFAWAEGNAAGIGEGEILTFEFEKPVQITALEIRNGYQRSDDHFKSNARLKEFSFGAAGDLQKNYNLADRRSPQKIELTAPAKGSKFDLKIVSGFAGSKYKDLAISELLFFDGDRPFILKTNFPEKFEAELRRSATGSPLAALLNRRVFNFEEFGGSLDERSLILRSDGTFVMYSKIEDESGSQQTIADGNWEIVEAKPDATKVKIFGKWNDLSSEWQPYQGESLTERTKIFNEILTIDSEKIKGGKQVETFWLK